MSDSQISYNQFLLKKQQILMAGQPDLPTGMKELSLLTIFHVITDYVRIIVRASS